MSEDLQSMSWIELRHRAQQAWDNVLTNLRLENVSEWRAAYAEYNRYKYEMARRRRGQQRIDAWDAKYNRSMSA